MKTIPVVLVSILTISSSVAEEARQSKWNVELPLPVVQSTRQPKAQSTPIDFTVLNSRTKETYVRLAPEMRELPPIEGNIKMTIQRVADPRLPEPPPPLPNLLPTDPAVIARLERLREANRATELAFLSASVHSDQLGAKDVRTLLRIYPNGQADGAVVAWSNVNFIHFSGQGGYRLNHADGTHQDVIFLMGISPIYRSRLLAKGGGAPRRLEDPQIPFLPNIGESGPSFIVIEGASDSPAAEKLEQIHELFRKSGKALEEQHLAREKAREERIAFLRANPPKPQDVTIRVWKRTP